MLHQNSILFAVVFQTPSTTVPSSVSNVTVNGLPVTEVLNISSNRASRADTSEMLFWMEWLGLPHRVVGIYELLRFLQECRGAS